MKCFDKRNKVFSAAWKGNDHWLVGRYVIMPDHLHFFCAPRVAETSLKKWMQVWRGVCDAELAVRRRQADLAEGFFRSGFAERGELRGKWRYVVENPVQAGLVERAEEWRWQGELNVLRWVGE